MLDKYVMQGRADALRRFGLDKTAGFLDSAKSFGAGQLGAAKDLFANMRGGLGGAFNPAFKGQSGGAFDPLARASHRAMALGNVRTLAPTLAAGGAMYMLHRHNQAKQDAQAQQQRVMMMNGGGGSGGYPMM